MKKESKIHSSNPSIVCQNGKTNRERKGKDGKKGKEEEEDAEVR